MNQRELKMKLNGLLILSWHINEKKTAAIPLDVAKQSSDPSSNANLFSKISTVGLE